MAYSHPPGQDDEPGLSARWRDGMLRLGETLRTSLPVNGPEDEKRIRAIFEAEYVKPEKVVGSPWYISDYICGVVELASKPGDKPVLAVRTLLLGPHQMPHRYTSISVLDFLKRVSKKKGSGPPWDPPIIYALTIRTRKGVPNYSFTWVDEPKD